MKETIVATDLMAMNRSAREQSSDGRVSPPQTAAWHMLPVAETFQRQKSDVAQGLTQAEAARRLAKYGLNALAQTHQRSTLSIFVAQFQSLIVALLVGATAIAFALGENIEAIDILVVIVLNAAIGFFTEWKAAQALSALQKQAVRVAHVIRDGVQSEIPAAELVPGDLIVLAAGARVPADGRIVECVRLQIEESALTGESNAVTKTADPLTCAWLRCVNSVITAATRGRFASAVLAGRVPPQAASDSN
jgi:Ca2+-transporting ATPase